MMMNETVKDVMSDARCSIPAELGLMKDSVRKMATPARKTYSGVFSRYLIRFAVTRAKYMPIMAYTMPEDPTTGTGYMQRNDAATADVSAADAIIQGRMKRSRARKR